jgi:hypothetical protein
MIKRPTITAGDIAGVYSVAKLLRLRKVIKLLPISLPASVFTTFLLSRAKVNNLFSQGGKIRRKRTEYNWDEPYYKLISKIELEERNGQH